METVSILAARSEEDISGDVPAYSFPENDEIMVKGLPQLSVPCATITVSSKHVLKKAAKKLGVPIHGFDFTSLGDTDVAASVTMDVPPHRGNPSTKRREFYGEWATFGSEAKESACLAALTYLKKEDLIVIHDTNFADMKRYKRRFEEERFWASELYDRAFSLKEELSAKASVPLAPDHVALNKPLGASLPRQRASTPGSTSQEAIPSIPKEMEIKPQSQRRTHVRKALIFKSDDPST